MSPSPAAVLGGQNQPATTTPSHLWTLRIAHSRRPCQWAPPLGPGPPSEGPGPLVGRSRPGPALGLRALGLTCSTVTHLPDLWDPQPPGPLRPPCSLLHLSSPAPASGVQSHPALPRTLHYLGRPSHLQGRRAAEAQGPPPTPALASPWPTGVPCGGPRTPMSPGGMAQSVHPVCQSL